MTREDRSALEGDLRESERAVAALNTRVAVCEQELADKELLLSQTRELLATEVEHKVC